MSKRISDTFHSLNQRKHCAFIPFLMAGAPTIADSVEFLHGLPEAGADLIEIGIPFSDPGADGPVIEQAGLTALSQGMDLHKILKMVAEFRSRNSHTPLILMGYFNPIYRYGVENFSKDAAQAGVDGLIVVDVPPEEETEIIPYLEQHSIDLVRLVAPTSPPRRQEYIVRHASGFVYYISVKGITGSKSAESPALAEEISQLKQHTSLPIAAGFGIKTTEQAAAAAKHADAVVVGSALVKSLAEDGCRATLALAAKLAEAIHHGRRE